jgi:uncharacterized protein
MRVVLDTNVLLVCASRKSRYHEILTSFMNGQYELCISTEILLEYEEVLTRHMGAMFAGFIIESILSAPNVLFLSHYMRWDMIQKDPDDNKFVDCAISAGADFITTDDKHFDILKTIDFPKILVVSTDDFLSMLQEQAS